MTRKKSSTSAEIAEQIGTAWLSERWLELIADVQRDIADILSVFDPMWSENVFNMLRDAIIRKDRSAVEDALAMIYDFTINASEAREKLLDLRAAIKSVPEVYDGGDTE